MERERNVSAAAQQERSGCGRPLSGLTVCLEAVTADEYSANSVNKDLNQKTNRALTILWLGLVSLEGAESRIESGNKCTFRAGQGCLWVVFYGFGACMWRIKQNHVNLPFLSSRGRIGVNPRHFNGPTKVLQSHCSVLLSQTWMRPPQPPYWKRQKLESPPHLSLFVIFQVLRHLLQKLSMSPLICSSPASLSAASHIVVQHSRHLCKRP